MHTPREILTALHDRCTLRARRGPIGIGLIGVGGWGASNAASIMRSRRFTIIGVCDVQQDVARRFARRYKTQYFACLEEMLADPGVQAVCISVPNPLHGALVRAAASTGKAVFIEKPLASTPGECREIGAYCAERSVLLQVGHQMRLEPAFQAVKSRLAAGKLGTPIFAQGIYTLPRQHDDGWRADPAQCPGGSMEQIGIHLIDVLVHLFGTPLASAGWARNIPRQEAGPDWGHVSIEFPNEVRAEVSASFSAPAHREVVVFCERGILATDGRQLTITERGAAARRERPRGLSGAVAQFVAFADSIELERPVKTGAADAVAVTNVIQSMHGVGSGAKPHGQSGVQS